MNEIFKACPALSSILRVPPLRFYRLKFGIPVVEPHPRRWEQRYRKSRDKRIVAFDQIGPDAWVYTTFTGFDLHRDQGTPLLYITVAHGFRRFAKIRAYRTVEEAVEGHEQIVRKLFDESDDDLSVRLERLLRRPARPYTFFQRCGQVVDRMVRRIKSCDESPRSPTE